MLPANCQMCWHSNAGHMMTAELACNHQRSNDESYLLNVAHTDCGIFLGQNALTVYDNMISTTMWLVATLALRKCRIQRFLFPSGIPRLLFGPDLADLATTCIP